MASQFSILKYISNHYTNEFVAVGLVVVSGEKAFFKVSQKKISEARKISLHQKYLLDFGIKRICAAFDSKQEDEHFLFKKGNLLNEALLQRLSIYNNGVLQFSSPTFIDIDFDLNVFEEYFSKYIGEEKKPEEKKRVSDLKQKIKSKLYVPLREKVDVDFTLKANAIPSLISECHLDSIGVNGAIHSSKAIDFNLVGNIAAIKNEIVTYESALDRLVEFAKKKEWGSEHDFYLIVDEYKGNTPSYNDLYAILKQNKAPRFKLIDSSKLPNLVKEVNKSKAKKFSEMLELQ